MNDVFKCLIYLALIGFAFFIIGRVLPKGLFSFEKFPFRSIMVEKEGKIYQRIGVHKLALMISPVLAVRCLIVYVVVQFIENQMIYPRVVGGSVGLPPLYTLIAAMIGGKLFGIIGIIFFIPLMAVMVELVKEDAENRLSRRENHIA